LERKFEIAEASAISGERRRFLSATTRVPILTNLLESTDFMSDLLDSAAIKTYMKKVPEWETDKKKIERVFEFDDFTAAMDFVNLVAEIAEEQEHHPDIDIRYNKVKLAIYTQTKDGLTELDFQLAERIDTLSEE
jgi:4a-hydroxytetrahydrobiopterin dehydratase